METDKFERNLIKHKKLLALFAHTQEPKLMGKIARLGEELVLANTEFQCEHCHNTKQLTIHHVIERKNRTFMDDLRYLCQRKYWANLCVLCIPCHAKVHYMLKEYEDKMLPISDIKINKLKKRYGV